MGTPHRSQIERLEPRQLFAADPVGEPLPVDVTPPTVVGLRVIGPPSDTQAIELTFSEPLHVGRAQRIDSYTLRGTFDEFDFPPGLYEARDVDNDGHEEEPIIPEELKIEEAIYDEAKFTVRLNVSAGFQLAHLERIRVDSGLTGVRDLAGNLLDGDGDGVAGGAFGRDYATSYAKKVVYPDADGDLITLRARKGRLVVWREVNDALPRQSRRRLGDALQVWLAGRITAKSVLTATIAPGKNGTGTGRTTIGLLQGIHDATVSLLNDPAFEVRKVDRE